MYAKKGAMHGIGTQHFDDGSTYTGVFHYNERQTYGIINWPDGRRYKGVFRNNRMDRV